MLQAIVSSRRIAWLFTGAALALLVAGCMLPPSQLAAAEVPVPAVPDSLLPPGLSGMIVEIVALVLGALGSAVLMVLRKKLGLSVNAEHRSALLPALQAGLDFAFAHPRLRDVDLSNPEGQRELLEEATSYVFRRVPDAARHFKLDRPAVAELIQARLPMLLGPGDAVDPPLGGVQGADVHAGAFALGPRKD